MRGSAPADELRTELHAAGGRPRRTALRGPAALTASERRVAALAADGQTNREIAQPLVRDAQDRRAASAQRL